MTTRAVAPSTPSTTRSTRPNTYRIFRAAWMSLAALGSFVLLASRVMSGEAGPLLATANPPTTIAVLAFAAAAISAVVAGVLRRAALEDEEAEGLAGAAH